MLSKKASICDVCPEGFYCTPQKGIDPVVCPAGFYCPLGTGLDWQACPTGTYGHGVGLVAEHNCTQCDGDVGKVSARIFLHNRFGYIDS
eukprot:m.302966 g.302966  ORF g.302966 m.302966 type:complete len:89 (+) comp40832_c0_seq1:9974-10240(+)